MKDKVYLGLDFYLRTDEMGDTALGIPSAMALNKGMWSGLSLAHKKILRLQEAVKELADSAGIDWSELHGFGLEAMDLE